MTGNAIKELRTELGMTSSAFAQLLGVNPSTLYRWEAEGEKEVKPDPNAARILAAMQKVRETKGSADLSSTLGAALLIGGGLFALFKLLEHLFSDSTANTAATAAPGESSPEGTPRVEGQGPTSGPSGDGKGGG
jgi:DNA-binding XRE family transcriptional regulator